LAHNKFARWDWIYGRSPRATLTHTSILSCGNVEIHLILNENRIVSCRFGGDFIGNLPSSDVEGRLTGVSYDVRSIEKCLSEIELCNYFDGVKMENLIHLIIGQ
jgi:lipoate-protein ligase A